MFENPEHLRHFRSNYLNLIILPTEACNFRCTYCYETFENKKMSPTVASGIKALISKRGKELDELEIGWFGGEPLLAMDVITDVCKHAIGASKNQGFVFNSGMTTNGYFLDAKRFRACLDHNVTFFQISLDGNPGDHNSSRKLASGAGTFDQIWSNLLDMKKTTAEFVVQLRLHYTLQNFIAVGQFGRRVQETFGADPRFAFYFRHISRLGGPNDAEIPLLSDQDKTDIEDHLWQTSGVGRPQTESEPYICYAAKGNSLVIRSTGRLAKCTVALSDDCNDIGWISACGEIRVDQTKFRRWVAPLLDNRAEELECPLGWVMNESASTGEVVHLDAAQAPSHAA